MISPLEEIRVVFVIASFFLGLFWLGCLVSAIFDANEETKIENELAIGLKKV
jgi:hypothetical protein